MQQVREHTDPGWASPPVCRPTWPNMLYAVNWPSMPLNNRFNITQTDKSARTNALNAIGITGNSIPRAQANYNLRKIPYNPGRFFHTRSSQALSLSQSCHHLH